MATLFVITAIATTIGALGGLISSGYDGLFLGAGIGLVVGVALWSTLIMFAQWRHERRLNRHFMQPEPLARHAGQDR